MTTADKVERRWHGYSVFQMRTQAQGGFLAYSLRIRQTFLLLFFPSDSAKLQTDGLPMAVLSAAPHCVRVVLLGEAFPESALLCESFLISWPTYEWRDPSRVSPRSQVLGRAEQRFGTSRKPALKLSARVASVGTLAATTGTSRHGEAAPTGEATWEAALSGGTVFPSKKEKTMSKKAICMVSTHLPGIQQPGHVCPPRQAWPGRPRRGQHGAPDLRARGSAVWNQAGRSLSLSGNNWVMFHRL